MIDLRSDTLTKPSAAMRAAMAAAEVGDDVYGEDPTVRALETRMTEILGKERALFVPSGTMGNQIALLLSTRPGDEVVAGEGTHCLWYEAGAAAALSGVQFTIAGSGGLFDGNDLEAVIKPNADYHARTSLVVVENTHNRAGGRVFPVDAIADIARTAQRHGLRLHLDGARLWNASVACGKTPRELAAPFDTVSVCFSKGLGAPVGSVLAGSTSIMGEARRLRRRLGGGMRQAGILAAGALYALDNNRERLVEDHRAAARLAEIVGQSADARVEKPETNIVKIEAPALSAEAVVTKARGRGVLLNATGPRTLRAVTHLDVTFEMVETAGVGLVEVLRERSGRG